MSPEHDLSHEYDSGYEYSEGGQHLAWYSGPLGGVHVSCFAVPPIDWPLSEKWMGGIEYHDITGEGPPSQEECWLLSGRPCWHDGTSLGFARRVAPFLPPPTEGPLPEIVRQHLTEFCKSEYNSHFRPGRQD